MLSVAVLCAAQFQAPLSLGFYTQYMDASSSRWKLGWHIPLSTIKSKDSRGYGTLAFELATRKYPPLAISTEINAPCPKKSQFSAENQQMRIRRCSLQNLSGFYKAQMPFMQRRERSPIDCQERSPAEIHHSILVKAEAKAILLQSPELMDEIGRIKQDYASGQLNDGGLTYAIGRQNTKLMCLLLEAGAPPDAPSLCKKTLKEVCENLGYAQGIELLDAYLVPTHTSYRTPTTLQNYNDPPLPLPIRRTTTDFSRDTPPYSNKSPAQCSNLLN